MKIERNNFFKAGKLTSILVTIMLIATAFSIFVPDVKSTTVTKTDVSAGYADASQTYVLVMNFTVTTQADTKLAGITLSVGQILENSAQADWGTNNPRINAYDKTPVGDYDWTNDCIWLDSDTNGYFYLGLDTILNGTAPPNYTGWNGYAKVGDWKKVKTYDAAEGGTWDVAADSIIFEGSDNNTCYMDELKAVTFDFSSTCNATNADITDMTFWMESGGAGGLQTSTPNKDTFLKNATYNAVTTSWNMTNLTQDINTNARFYVAVNTSASASHTRTIKMEIPTKVDGGTSGVYNYDDQGIFFAGTNDTGGITNLYNKTIDTFAPVTSVTTITPYWYTSQPQTITGTATDNVSGVKNVTLCWRFSTDNSTWGTWCNFSQIDTTPWPSPSWSFTFSNLTGFYQFYSRGYDNVSNYEAAPGTADAKAGYDITNPTATISIPVDGNYYKTINTISGTCSDTGSNISSVII